MIKPKKLLLWILFSLVAFNVFNYVKMHTRGDVIAYKKFSKALMKGNAFALKNTAEQGLAKKVLSFQEKRMNRYNDLDIVFTYYKIKSRTLSADGKTSKLVGEQISRVNPLGYDTLWGENAVKVKHSIVLVMHNNAWKVESFIDPATFD